MFQIPMHQKDIATLKIVERAMIFFIIILVILGLITRDSAIVHFTFIVFVFLVIVSFFTRPVPHTLSVQGKGKIAKKPSIKNRKDHDDTGSHQTKQEATKILHARFEEKEGSKN